MSVNIFDKPLAANPISEFAALPLQFINRLQQQKKQEKYQSMELAGKLEDTLFGTKALPGDSKRHQEILKSFDAEIDNIVNNAGENYEDVNAQLFKVKGRMKKELLQGELGAINGAYTTAAKSRANNMKLYQDKKIQKAGLDMELRNMASHRTQQDEYGNWNSYNSYTPSNMTNPKKFLSDAVDEINKKYDSDGQENIGQDIIIGNLSQTMQTNPEVNNALKENFLATYGGSKDPKEVAKNFQAYKSSLLRSIVADKTYKKKTVNANDVGNMGPKIIKNFKISSNGSSLKGGSSSGLRQFIEDTTGLEATKEFKDYLKSSRGAHEVKSLVATTGVPFPTTHRARVAYIEKYASGSNVTDLHTIPLTQNQQASIIDNKGFLKENVSIIDQNGKKLQASEIEDLQGSKDGRVTRVLRRVTEGEYAGYLHMIDKEGRDLLVEPTDTGTLFSSSFNHNRIMAVADPRRTPTRTRDVDVKQSFDAIDVNGKVSSIPKGNYQVRHIVDEESGEKAVVLYMNGKRKYLTKGKTFEGYPIYSKLD